MKFPLRAIAILLAVVLLAAYLPLSGTSASAVRSDGYLTFNEAVQKIKEHMLSRSSETITLKVYIEDDRVLGDMQIRELFDEYVYAHNGSGAEGDYLRYCHTSTSYYMPEHRREGNKHWITLMYTAYFFQSADRETAVTAKVNEILASLNLGGKSDYEKINAIYSYVCKNVDYDLDYEQKVQHTQEYNDIHSAYGALVNKKAVCEGYALSLYRLLLAAGIDNRVIVSADHAWNLVKLGNLYYNLDATWDYGIENPDNFRWFLIGSADFVDQHHSTGEYFNTKEFRQKYPESPINYGAAASVSASGSCGSNANWNLSADGTLTISGSGAIMDTAEYESLWSGVNMYIKKVVIQNGITAIGDYAFWNCPQLTTITIPSTVTSIGQFAFERCTSLKEIAIPNSVTSIGKAAFSACVSLEKVVLPSGLTEIQDNTFNFCMSLKGITIPASVHTIGNGAFASAFDPAANVALTIPVTVEDVRELAFGWSGIKSVDFKADTSHLHNMVFYMCKNLETVKLNNSIGWFHEEIFSHCYRLKSVEMPESAHAFTDSGQGIFRNCYALEDVTIPDGVSAIPNGTFFACMSLESIELHDEITSIGDVAFSETGIKNLVIPRNVSHIGYCAFRSAALQTIRFEGYAPRYISDEGSIGSFGQTITVIYPGEDGTWTDAVKQKLSIGVDLQWVGAHDSTGNHTMSSTWFFDSNSHWKQCIGCDYKEEITAHEYSYDCDTTCNVCVYQRPANHTYVWGHNTDQHWCTCECGTYLVEPQGHNYNNGFCIDCGAKEGSISTEEPPTQPSTEPPTEEPTTPPTYLPGMDEPPTPPSTEPENTGNTAPYPTTTPVPDQPTGADQKNAQGSFPWHWILIGVAVLAGAAVAIILIKRKS